MDELISILEARLHYYDDLCHQPGSLDTKKVFLAKWAEVKEILEIVNKQNQNGNRG